ncbi:MAG TPA: hypothetical protein PLK46_10815 [Propioniciclava sp.]|uniref:helix-turn-helix domain-containing protein n=1 Tax=Propioniciclava sp. TaxID=2038686 RepID=UPI002CF0CCC0|nr:hypothetical protein [Propioniciclava sp.]HRL48250.1 hypothetical protein [Propioniciclava sp.]HRL80805.1 hypothetical protein [Propioniciclava sp.]
MADDPPTFSDVLTAAIRRRGLSLERIRTRLDAAGVPVSIATLSYWQSGRSLPTRSRSYHTLVELERILGVEPGHLTQLTHTADGRTRREQFEWQTVIPVRDLATQIIDDLGIEMQGRLTRVAMMDRVHVRADKSEAMQHSEVVWRVERQGRPRWAVVLEQDADTEAMPKIEAVFGCSVGEVVKVPARRLLVAEMVAARPMLRGEHFLAEYRISYGHTVTPSFRTQRAVADTVRTLGLSVSFDPGTVPARVSSGFQASMGQPPEHPTPIVVTGAQTQAVWVEARPGVYSLMWEWD